ncbi:hypothetical protein SBADM41S_00339 [Streptomyces badius]
MLTPASTRRSAAIVEAAALPPMEWPAMPTRRGSIVPACRQAGRGPVSRSSRNEKSAARPVATAASTLRRPASSGCASTSSQAAQGRTRPSGSSVPVDSYAWSAVATTYPRLASSSASPVSVARGVPKPGESRTSGKRPGAGRAAVREWVRVAATRPGHSGSSSPRCASIGRASASGMYGAGSPPLPGRAG